MPAKGRPQSIPAPVGVKDSEAKRILWAIRERLESDEPFRQQLQRVLKGQPANGGSSSGSNVPGGAGTQPVGGRPSRVHGLAAAGTFGAIILTVDAVPNNAAYLEFLAAPTDALGDAVVVGTSQAPVFVHYVADSTTRYYWVRGVGYGEQSLRGPVNATAGTPGTSADDPDYVKEVLKGQIGHSELVDELSSNIDLITAGAEVSGSVNARIASEAQERSQQIAQEAQSRADAIAAEAQDRATAILSASNELQANIDTEIQDRTTAVAAEAQARADALTQEVQDRTAAILAAKNEVQTNLDGETADRIAAVNQEAQDRTDAVNQEAQARADALTSQFNTLHTQITNEATQRQTGDESLAESISTLAAGSGEQFDVANIWYFDDQLDAWTGGTVANGYLIPANGANPYVRSPTGVGADGDTRRYVKARIKRAGAPVWAGKLWWKAAGASSWSGPAVLPEPPFEASGISVIAWEDVPWSGQVDQIRVLLTTEQTATDQLNIDWLAIGRPTPGASTAALRREQSARIAADDAEAADRETLATQLTGVADPSGKTIDTLTSGLLYQERQARSTADGSMASDISSLQASYSDQQTELATKASNTRVDQVESDAASARSTLQTNLTAAYGAADSGLQDDYNGKFADAAEARDALSAEIQSEATARTSADSAEATKRETLSTSLVGSADPDGKTLANLTSGLLFDERQARSSADSAMVSNISALQATTNANTGAIQDEATARAAADSAEATKRETLSTKVLGAADPDGKTLDNLTSGLLYDERQARSDADGAQVSRISTMEARMPAGTGELGTSADIASEQQARVSADSALSDRTDLLEARMPTGTGKLATASALAATNNTVAQHGADITTNSNSITANTTAIGDKLDASAIENYYTKAQTDGAISDAESGLTQSFTSQLNTKADQTDLDTTNANVTAAQQAADDAQADADAASTLAASKLDASAITDYYTKTQTDGKISSSAAGLTQSFNASLATTNSNVAAAQDAADDANAAAATAAGIANGKGKIIYQATAPTGANANANNLWIDKATQAPHTWNGTTWVKVTDKAATDAAAAAVAAQATADAAQQAAAANASSIADTNNTVTQQGNDLDALSQTVQTNTTNIGTKADASALAATNTQVSQHGDDLTALGQTVSGVTARLPAGTGKVASKADTDAAQQAADDAQNAADTVASNLQTTNATVTQQGNDLSALSQTVQSNTARMPSGSGELATASALSVTEAQVIQNADKLKTQSQSVTALESSVLASGAAVFHQDNEPTTDDLDELPAGAPTLDLDFVSGIYLARMIPPGSIWYDTDDQNRPYVYEDGAWIDTRDQKIADKLDASAISDYYTKTQTDGKISQSAAGLTQSFNASLATTNSNVQAAQDAADAAQSDATANATALQDVSNTVTQQGNDLDALSQTVQTNTTNIGTKADASALAATNTQVSQHGDDLTALGQTVSQQGTEIAGKASASALASTQSQVTQHGSDITANTTALNAIQSRMPTGTGGLATSASVSSEASARTSADSALASRAAALEARMPSGTGGLATAASVASEATARANADSSMASDISQLNTTVGDHSTSIQTNATSINGLSGKYTVKIDNNGYVTGFGLASTDNDGTPTSEFAIVADKFSVIKPGGTSGDEVYPFIITGGQTYLNSLLADRITVKTAMIQNNAVTSAKIVDAAIATAKIADAAVTTAKIKAANITSALIANAVITEEKVANSAISSAKIANAAITAAKIGNAEVSTLKIAGRAATASQNVYTAGAVNLGTGWSTVASITVSGDNSYEYLVFVGFRFQLKSDDNSDTETSLSTRALDGSSVVMPETTIASTASFAGNQKGVAYYQITKSGQYGSFFRVSGGGNHTFYLQARTDNTAAVTRQVSGRNVTVLVLKR